MTWRAPSVAWLNLTHQPSRLLILLSGIVFAVVLMFMFTGFKHALYDSQLQLIRHLNGDVFILSQRRASLGIPQQIPRQLLYQAESYQGVEAASALYMGEAFWKNPDTQRVRLARVIAFNPAEPLFDFPELQQNLSALRLPNAVWIDRLAREEMGRTTPGTVTELADRQVQIVGNFTLGNDFSSLNGNVLMSDENFQRYFANRDPKEGNRSLDTIDLAAVTIKPGFNAEAVAALLQKGLPRGVNVMSRDQFQTWERRYWEENTNIGFVFGLLTVMGFVIGIILCYQIIYSDIADHLLEYATLKAIGYRNRFLVSMVLQQALLLGVLGFIPGFILSVQLYKFAKMATGLLFQMTLEREVQMLVTTILMCFISGAIALLKVQKADPAEIF